MSDGNNNKDKVFYITHKGELLFWLVIVLFFSAGFCLNHIKKARNADNYYSIFLPDVDGLIVGSPVRVMGIEIGHVVKINPIGGKVIYITDRQLRKLQAS